MVVPVADQAAQQVWSAQERRVEDAGAAENEVVAAAGAGVTPVEHELLGTQAGQVGRFIEMGRAVDQFVPVGGRLNVDFDHPGIRRDAEVGQARIGRRLVTFDDDRRRQYLGSCFDSRHQIEVIIKRFGRRHEEIEHAVARLRRNRGADDRRGGRIARLPASGRHRTPGGLLERPIGEMVASQGRLLGGQVLAVADRKLGADLGMRTQGRKGLRRIGSVDVRVILLGHPGL